MTGDLPSIATQEKVQRAVALVCSICTVRPHAGPVPRCFSVRHGEYEVCAVTFEFAEDVAENILSECLASHMARSH